MAPFAVDEEGFLSEAFGIPEAVALLGPAVLCGGREAGSGYVDLELAPRAAHVRRAALETKDGELIGLVVEIDPPSEVDIAALAARLGSLRAMPSMPSEAGDAIDAQSKAFRGTLVFGRRGHGDPKERRLVHRIIFRRTPTIEILPDKFLHPGDLVRLVRLALRPRAPEVIAFYGTLGVAGEAAGNRLAFRPAVEMRNVASASLGLRIEGKRRFVRSVEVAFASPIAADAGELARVLGLAFAVAAPAEISGATRTIRLPGGTIRLEWAPGGVRAVAIERAA